MVLWSVDLEHSSFAIRSSSGMAVRREERIAWRWNMRSNLSTYRRPDTLLNKLGQITAALPCLPHLPRAVLLQNPLLDLRPVHCGRSRDIPVCRVPEDDDILTGIAQRLNICRAI